MVLEGELKFRGKDANAEGRKLFSYILSIAGDCRLMISHRHSSDEWEKYREQCQSISSIDEQIQNVIDPSVLEQISTGRSRIRF